MTPTPRMLVSALLLVALAGLPLRTQAEGCATAGCHEDLLQQKVTHSALAVGDCTDCHSEAEGESRCGSGKRFTTTSDPELCLMCHEPPAEQGRHAALEMGCTACHDPHGSRTPAVLKAPVAELCKECHETPQGRTVHAPVEEGDCTTCHEPHAAPNAKLLVSPAQELCGACHDKTSGEDVHAPVSPGSCLDCHGPHATNQANLLVRAPRDLCSDCHDVAGTVGSVGSHYPVASGDCLACHATHANGTPGLLKTAGPELCASCHAAGSRGSVKRVSVNPESHPAAEDCGTCHRAHGSDRPNLLAKAPETQCYDCHPQFRGRFLHSAVRLGRCGDCHDPHGSGSGHLLRERGAELCFRCHQDDVTGRQHVHAPVADGSCGACHDPHASDHPQLLTGATVNGTCVDCHDVGLDKPHVHAAVERFGCTGCHDPHGTAQPRQLLADERALCTGCHVDQKDGLHVFTGTSGRPHPVSGVPDPKRGGRELSCTSCHSPHASAHPNLWYSGESRMESCGRCHKQYAAVRPSPVPRPASVPVSAEPAASLPAPDPGAGTDPNRSRGDS